MSILFTILVVLIIIAAILLILAVLAQNSKGGMASNFGAGNQAFGVRQTIDLLEKITWGLIVFIIVASIAASFTFKSVRNEGIVTEQDLNKNVKEVALPTPETTPAEAPAQEAPAAPAE